MKRFNLLATAILSTTVLVSSAAGQGRGIGFPGQGERGGRGGPPVNPNSKALDTDGDGELSATEIEAAATALKTLDKDEDGKLSGDEIRPQRSNGQRSERRGRGRSNGSGRAGGPDFLARVKSFDANEDGKLQKSEIPERMQRITERGDTDGDDALDEAEIKALTTSFRGGRGPGHSADQGRGHGDEDADHRHRRGDRDGDRGRGNDGRRGRGERGHDRHRGHDRGGDHGRGGRDRDGERGPGGVPNSAELVSQAMTFDADEDGKLSKEELEQAVEQFVAQMEQGDRGQRSGRGRQGGRECQRPDSE